MYKKALQYAKKHKIMLIFVLILAVGIFLRTYNLNDWLFFKGDQNRDLLLVTKAVEKGPGWLPLLGPKAGGTFLRLGPVFYYFQYVSASIFGTIKPSVFAYQDVLFSILTIPLLFLFLKEFFSKKWSLALVAAYAVCFFAIQYARFAWNPNSLPFFNLLFFYSLLKLFDEKAVKKYAWACVAGFSFAVASQLHFVSLIALPIATVFISAYQIFVLKKSKLQLTKYVLVAAIFFVILYFPVLLSDMRTDWDNTMNFLGAFGKKSSDGTILSLIKNDILSFSKYFFIILTGIIGLSKKAYYITTVIPALGLVSSIYLFWKEKDDKKRVFILAVLAWLIAYFITYYPLGPKVQPRHFLVMLPVPFIMIGFLSAAINRLFGEKRTFFVPVLLFTALIALNSYSVYLWFGEIHASQASVTNPRKSGLLKSVGGESWWHLQKVSEFMHGNCDKSSLVITPPSQIYRSLFSQPLKFVGEKRPFLVALDTLEKDDGACYYAVYFTHNNIAEKMAGKVKIVSKKSFGDMSVVRFEMPPSVPNTKGIIKNPFRRAEKAKESTDDADNTDGSDIVDPALSETPPPSVPAPGVPVKKDRVFWKDLF